MLQSAEVIDRPRGLWITLVCSALLVVGVLGIGRAMQGDRGAAAGFDNPFQLAAFQGDLRELRCQWQRVNGRPDKYQTEDLRQALRIAAAMGRLPIVDQLLTWGVDANCPGPNGRTPLMCAAGADNSAAVARRLLAAGADANLKDFRGDTAISAALDYHDSAMAAQLAAHR